MACGKVALVWGVFGSGKSRTIAAVICELTRNKVCRCVHFCAAQSLALDSVIRRLHSLDVPTVRFSSRAHLEKQKMSKKSILSSFDEICSLVGAARPTSVFAEYLKEKKKRDRLAARRIYDRKQEKRFLESRKWCVKVVLRNAKAVCTTVNNSPSVGGAGAEITIVDEAGQIPEHEMIPAEAGAQRMALVGDHKQLPPVIVSSRKLPPPKAASLFERLITNAAGETTNATAFLDTQFRCPPVLAAHLSAEYYEGKLRSAENAPAEAKYTFSHQFVGVDTKPDIFLARQATDRIKPYVSPSTAERVREMRDFL
ncbi:unnamed protein product, partial [Amoebophrya sp. A120]|eukprot:GSA120T00022845001.1